MKQKNNKPTFKELWKNPLYNSLLKLSMWGIFFILVFLILIINNKVNGNHVSNQNSNEVQKVNFIKFKKNLVNNEQKIVYKYNELYITGSINNNILIGTLENSNDDIIKIKYDGNTLYQVKKDIEIENNGLLDDFNLDYLLPSKVIELVDNSKAIALKGANDKVYSYSFDNKTISFYLNDKIIEKIIILDNEQTYNLEFSEVI